MVWDGRKGCPHHWGGEIISPSRSRNKQANSTIGVPESNYAVGTLMMNPSQGFFCSLCGAWRGSLGLEPDFRDYIRHLMQVMEQVWRVLKPTGSAWINLGDSYGGNQGRGSGKGNEKGQKIQQKAGLAKSLCAIPDRFKIAMIDAGWICRNEICWWKRNAMPSSAKDRFTNDFEKIFFFVKQQKYYFKQQLEPAAQATIRRVGLGEARGKGENGNKAPVTDSYKRCNSAAVSRDVYNDSRDHLVCAPSGNGRNRRCVWDVCTKPSSEPHFAMFPDTLVTPMLSAGCPEKVCSCCGKPWMPAYEENIIPHDGDTASAYPTGSSANRLALLRQAARERGEEYSSGRKFTGFKPSCSCGADYTPGVVLDPFSGMGTVGLVAARLGMDFVGIELSEKYAEKSEERIAGGSVGKVKDKQSGYGRTHG